MNSVQEKSVMPLRNLVGLAFIMALGMIAPPARADLVISTTATNNFTVAAGSSSSFDIVLLNNDPVGSTPYHIGSFGTAINVPDGAGITITGVDQNTSDPYIFANNLTSDPASFYSSWTSIDGSAGDYWVTPDPLANPSYPQYVEIAPGQQYGLAHVSFHVARNATALVSVLFPNGVTNISDGQGVLSFNGPNGGTIIVTGSQPVPEPGTLVLAGLLCSLGGVAYRRSRTRKNAIV